jgi:hypothetical protein
MGLSETIVSLPQTKETRFRKVIILANAHDAVYVSAHWDDSFEFGSLRWRCVSPLTISPIGTLTRLFNRLHRRTSEHD